MDQPLRTDEEPPLGLPPPQPAPDPTTPSLATQRVAVLREGRMSDQSGTRLESQRHQVFSDFQFYLHLTILNFSFKTNDSIFGKLFSVLTTTGVCETYFFNYKCHKI